MSPATAVPDGRISDPTTLHATGAAAEIAADLLADSEVLSVTMDLANDEATLRYRDQRLDRTALADIAERFRSDAQGLALTSRTLAAEVECWPDPRTGVDYYVRAPKQATGWRRLMHLTLAAVWFTLAVLGAILPGLPCTCFLLLTSYSLCRSSTRLHKKLLDSRWFGPTLRHWRIHRGVRPGIKTKALSLLTLMVGCSLAFAPLPAVAWWIVAAAGAIGVACVSRLRVIEC